MELRSVNASFRDSYDHLFSACNPVCDGFMPGTDCLTTAAEPSKR